MIAMRCVKCRFHQNAPACQQGVCRPLDRTMFEHFGCTLFRLVEPDQRQLDEWAYQLQNAKQHLHAKQLVAVSEVVEYLADKSRNK